MTDPARVLLVDDSAAVRRLLARAIAAEPGIEVVAAVADGRAAIAAVERDRPDVVILDLDLPDLPGAEVMTILRARWPRLPVVLFSGMARADSGAVFEAVSSGAVHFVSKPSGASALQPLAHLRSELFPVVRMLAGQQPEPRPARAAAGVPGGVARARGSRPRLVTVASSTGGPDALATLLAGMRPFPDVAMLVAQHMPRQFTAMLAGRLDGLTEAEVREAVDGEVVRDGQVLIAPGGQHLEVRRQGDTLVVRLDNGPKVNFCRPSADVLFRSAAAAAGRDVLAVVLSGMGRDGADGAAAVVAAGGDVVAQSHESAVCPSMPAAVGPLATAVLPVADLAAELLRRCRGDAVR